MLITLFGSTRVAEAILALWHGGDAVATTGSPPVTLRTPPATATPYQLSPTDFAITTGATHAWPFPDDTPAAPFVDRDGRFWMQSADASYAVDAKRTWTFFSGSTADDVVVNETVTNAVDPEDPRDSNGNTTWRCNFNSPTGREASWPKYEDSPKWSERMGYSQRNYCDLMGVWVDPDTGHWHGIVHNEFTPLTFGTWLHYDALDVAVSTDGGFTWRIKHHILTSPLPTVKDDNTTFPQATFSYGAGDARLIVDAAAGWFYILYGSRIVDKGAGWGVFRTHAARARMSDKLLGGWEKWYDGKWGEPGVGGRESSLFPVDEYEAGYAPLDKEYDPHTEGNCSQQVAAGVLAPTTPLFWMDVSFSAHLGLWIGEPSRVRDTSKLGAPRGPLPQYYYATADLGTQKWSFIGDSGNYTTSSNYRWFMDGVSRTSQQIVGKDLRAYCSFGCSGGADGEFVELSIDGTAAKEVDPEKEYTIGTKQSTLIATGGALGGVANGNGSPSLWRFKPTGDGAYTITDTASGRLLDTPGDNDAARAWGVAPALSSAAASSPTVSQQWWVLPNRSPADNSRTGSFRVVNRFSGLALALRGRHGKAELTPARSWVDNNGSGVGGGRKPEEQELWLEVKK